MLMMLVPHLALLAVLLAVLLVVPLVVLLLTIDVLARQYAHFLSNAQNFPVLELAELQKAPLCMLPYVYS